MFILYLACVHRIPDPPPPAPPMWWNVWLRELPADANGISLGCRLRLNPGAGSAGLQALITIRNEGSSPILLMQPGYQLSPSLADDDRGRLIYGFPPSPTVLDLHQSHDNPSLYRLFPPGGREEIATGTAVEIVGSRARYWLTVIDVSRPRPTACAASYWLPGEMETDQERHRNVHIVESDSVWLDAGP